MIYLSILVYMFALNFCGRLLSGREGGVGTIHVFGIAVFVYNMAIPLEFGLSGESFIYTVNGWHSIGHETTIFSAAASIVALISFTIGYYTSKFVAGVGRQWVLNNKHKLDPYALLSLGIGAMMLIFFRRELLLVSTYEGNVFVSANNALFSYLSKIVIISLSAYAIIQARIFNRYRTTIAISAIIALWAVYSKNKDPLVFAAISLSSILYDKGYMSKKYMYAFAPVIVILAASTLPLLFSQYRSGVELSWERLRSGGFFVRSDPAGPFYTLSEVVRQQDTFQFGTSYIQSAISWVPGFIWPSKPMGFAEAFAQQNISGWRPGMGFGFSLLGESYVNFGVMGAFVQYLMIGLAWGIVWRIIKYSRVFDRPHFNALYMSVGFYILFIMHRGDTSFIVTQMFQSILPFALISIGYKIVKS